VAVEDLAKLVGMTEEPVVMEVEKGAIKRFASAVDDPNPLYVDEEYARNSRFGAVIAPPGFFGWPAKPGPMFGKLQEELLGAMAKEGFTRLLDGGIDYEFFLPVRAGDTLVSYRKVANITVREGKAGKMVLGITETSYLNQHGDLVARARQTLICR